MTQDKKPALPVEPSTDRSGGDSALMVWLKLGGLLIGLSAFCALIFVVSRMILPH